MGYLTTSWWNLSQVPQEIIAMPDIEHSAQESMEIIDPINITLLTLHRIEVFKTHIFVFVQPEILLYAL